MPDIAQFVEQIIFASICGLWGAWGLVLWVEFFNRYIGDK